MCTAYSRTTQVKQHPEPNARAASRNHVVTELFHGYLLQLRTPFFPGASKRTEQPTGSTK